jgi:ferredoxin
LAGFSHALLIVFGILFLFTGWFAVASLFEKEKRASTVAALLSLIFLIPIIFWILLDFPEKGNISFVIVIFLVVFAVLMAIPCRMKKKIPDYRSTRIDERATPFSRYFSTPEQKEDYYNTHPEYREVDDKLLRMPGLLSPESAQFNQKIFASARIYDKILTTLRFDNDGEVLLRQDQPGVPSVQSYIMEWAKNMGILDAGFCKLDKAHFYTHRGRHHLYGEPVESNHTHAIVFLVDMDRLVVSTAPKAPVIMETNRRYLECGLIALQVASFLRSMGWEAKAHIDGNYEVICPLVARDAGLGELGRMGVLISNRTGPRCRISVVTTTAPFKTEKPLRDLNTIRFCELCKKCAQCCPPGAIPSGMPGKEPESAGWKVDGDRCFAYWCKQGTDCARCMAVCPFSHDNSFLHNLAGNTISANFARKGGGISLGFGYWGLQEGRSDTVIVFDSVNRCNIYYNTALQPGFDLYSYTEEAFTIYVDTFSVIQPVDYHTFSINKLDLHILSGKTEQVSSDLYVSPNGSDSNTGLTPEEPLKSIPLALIKLVADSTEQHTIHLADGTYFPELYFHR